MNKIINMDCIEYMNTLPNNYFDCIFSDVPYLISKGGSTKIKGSMSWNYKKEKANGKIFEYNEITEKEYLPHLYRILNDRGHIYIMCNNIHLANIQKEMEKVGFIINNILVMVKSNAVVNKHYMKNCEFTIFARKGKSKGLKDYGIKTAINVNIIKENKIHPTQKPLEYVKTLINNSTKKGDKVFDPFLGSGTTSIACELLNIDFYGTEIDKKYYKLSRKRLRNVRRLIRLQKDITLTKL